MYDPVSRRPGASGSGRRFRHRHGKQLTIALAGNANVGKSAIFNQLTGLAQEVGNWSGKTVGVKEGTLVHHEMQIRIVDLPGIYSLTTYSLEESITRDYLLSQHPDVVINVLDTTSLERNLYLTLQLKEMDLPLVIALNYADIAGKKHIHTDITRLGEIFNAPVINTIAIKGIGIHELIDAALEVIAERGNRLKDGRLKYGAELETRIDKLEKALGKSVGKNPLRWTAVALLAGDSGITGSLGQELPELIPLAKALSAELAAVHGEESAVVITAERYALAASIADQTRITYDLSPRQGSRLDNIFLHPVAGYIMFFATMAVILIFISLFGGWVTGVIEGFFNNIDPHLTGVWGKILWSGAVVGFYAALTVALGFILPFFLILGWLGESGYLPRIAFLMDRPCHIVGLHGQASLPLITALGCNVPACLGCRVMDNKRDRLIAVFLSTMVPCSARTSVVLGLVGAFVGWQWAVALLVFQFIIIFVAGWILNRLSPGRSPGIIMEIPEYRIPNLKIVGRQAWYRFKDFLAVGVPFIVIGSVVIESLRIFGILDNITQFLTPLTVNWLGLPAYAGVLLILGVLRKEANLALLISFAGGAAVTAIISPLQMVVLAIVVMLYIPCISTMAVMVKEISLKNTAVIVAAEIAVALLVGGFAYRVLGLFMV